MEDHDSSSNDHIINPDDVQASKKRKAAEKIVVRVKLEENGGKKMSSRSDQNPACSTDCWSWRKYGQKPIKGSPYPRGYYKCSTSKSCSAKKQVELCRTDASMLIITYTSSHNHPDPTAAATLPKKPKTTHQHHSNSGSSTNELVDEKNQKPVMSSTTNSIINNGVEDELNDNFHYVIPITPPEDDHCLTLNQLENRILFDEHDDPPLSYPNLMTFSPPKTHQQQNDLFYDELEELPMSSSSFKIFMTSNFFEDRLLVQPP